jgi:hypothetical protein
MTTGESKVPKLRSVDDKKLDTESPTAEIFRGAILRSTAVKLLGLIFCPDFNSIASMRSNSSRIALIGIPRPYVFTNDSKVVPRPYSFILVGRPFAVKNLGSECHAESILFVTF